MNRAAVPSTRQSIVEVIWFHYPLKQHRIFTHFVFVKPVASKPSTSNKKADIFSGGVAQETFALEFPLHQPQIVLPRFGPRRQEPITTNIGVRIAHALIE